MGNIANGENSLVEKLSCMTILCHFGVWMRHSKHSCHIGPFSYHIGQFFVILDSVTKTMFSTSDFLNSFFQKKLKISSYCIDFYEHGKL